MAGQLLSLPDGVATFVLAFLLSADDVRATAKARRPQQLPPHVVDFASVCTAWKALIHEIASANVLSCFTITLAKPTRNDVVKFRRQLILRRSHTQQLAVERIPSFDSIDGRTQWRCILSHTPHTTLLDLTRVDKQSRTFVEVFFEAAAWQLRRVDTLRLPLYSRRGVFRLDAQHAHGRDEGTRIVASQWRKRWSSCASCVALRLNMSPPDCQPAIRDLGDVLFEPRAAQGVFSSICTEQWVLDLHSWTQFCESCTSLTEFDWLRVPFATSFFEIFGQHTQPKLTKLTLRTAVNWDWDYYLRESLPASRKAMAERGFGGTATEAWAVFRACPNLRELRVEQ